MKKTIAYLLTLVVVVLTLTAPISVSAQSGFTVSCSPETVTAQPGSDDVISVSINLSGNPGLWSTRIFVVYPEGLSLIGTNGKADIVNPGRIYGASDLTVGIPDLALDDSRVLPALKAIIASRGLSTEGYLSTALYFEPEAFETITYTNGTLATLNFRVTDNVTPNSVSEIKILYGEHDFLYATIKSGKVSFISYYPETVDAKVSFLTCYHTSSHFESKAPTCTEAGYERTVCDSCKLVLSETAIDSSGHSYTSEGSITVVEPDCTSGGHTVKICDTCGDTVTTDLTDPLGHNGNGERITVSSTCTAAGTLTVYCTCGELYSTSQLPLADHSYKDTVVAPTRTEEGYTLHTCTECGYEYKDSFVDAIGGDFITGDLNGDDVVNAMDVNIVRRILNGSVTPSEAQAKSGDINGDGVVNGIDANILARFASGIINTLG